MSLTCSDSLSLNDVIKPIDFFIFVRCVHSISNSYFKSLTILYGVVLFSLITYDLKIQNPMRFIIMLVTSFYNRRSVLIFYYRNYTQIQMFYFLNNTNATSVQ